MQSSIILIFLNLVKGVIFVFVTTQMFILFSWTFYNLKWFDVLSRFIKGGSIFLWSLTSKDSRAEGYVCIYCCGTSFFLILTTTRYKSGTRSCVKNYRTFHLSTSFFSLYWLHLIIFCPLPRKILCFSQLSIKIHGIVLYMRMFT